MISIVCVCVQLPVDLDLIYVSYILNLTDAKDVEHAMQTQNTCPMHLTVFHEKVTHHWPWDLGL